MLVIMLLLAYNFIKFLCSGNTHDNMLLAKLESVYTGSGEPGSSMVSHLQFS